MLAKGGQLDLEPLRDIILDRATFDVWALTYSEQLAQIDQGQAAHLMQKSNPRFVLRNHLGETVIRAAQGGDFAPVQQMLAVLQSPYTQHPDNQDWAGFPPDWASSISISCSS